jgi:hypothetical protein
MYTTYYSSIIENILNKSCNNSNIVLIINNYFNIIEHFSHIIKKKYINIHILIDNKLIYNKLKNNIIGEECEKFINIYKTHNDFIEYKRFNEDVVIDNIVIFHLFSLDYLNKILIFCNNVSCKNTIINIYSSLSNSHTKTIEYKNYIRNKLKSIFSYKMGTVLNFSEVLNVLENNDCLKIKSIKMFKKSNYVIYGENIVYKIVLLK